MGASASIADRNTCARGGLPSPAAVLATMLLGAVLFMCAAPWAAQAEETPASQRMGTAETVQALASYLEAVASAGASEGTGTQSASAVPVFENGLADGTLKVAKRVAGENPTPGKRFKMHVKLNAPAGTDLPSGTFKVTRDAQAFVVFDANGGTGSMDGISAKVGDSAVLPDNGFGAPAGKEFAGWNDRADGTGTAYAAGASITPDAAGTVTLYAQWAKPKPVGTVRYAVSPYGIGVDHDSQGNEMGITFGPATGNEWYYNNSSKTRVRSHAVAGTAQEEGQPALTGKDGDGHAITDGDSGIDAAGNAYRCIHYDDWNTIIWWNRHDPHVYDKCVAKGCSHAVELSVTADRLKAWNYAICGNDDYATDFSQVADTFDGNRTSNGDGRDFVSLSMWDLQRDGVDITQANCGYSASLVRALLVGTDSLTKLDARYASTDAMIRYTQDTCMLAAFPEELKAAIGAKDLSYTDSLDTGKNGPMNGSETSDAGCFDKLWLPSYYEICSSAGPYSSDTGLQSGVDFLLRSPYGPGYVWYIQGVGMSYFVSVNYANGVAPGFTLSRSDR